MKIQDERIEFCRYFTYSDQGFEIWIAAKKNAIEMRKPPVVIEHWHQCGTFSVMKPRGQAFRNIKLGFVSAGQAKEWAVRHKYRVISE